MHDGRPLWAYNNYRVTLDQDLIHARMTGWFCYQYGLTGYMHWAFLWNPAAWTDAFTAPFGPGEGYLVYLDPQHPGELLDSVRYEGFRDMAEDYDLLSAYASAGGDAHALCGRLLRSPNDYTLDPACFRAARHDLLADLSARQTAPSKATR